MNHGNENNGFPLVCLMENGHSILKAQSCYPPSLGVTKKIMSQGPQVADMERRDSDLKNFEVPKSFPRGLSLTLLGTVFNVFQDCFLAVLGQPPVLIFLPTESALKL